MTLFIEKRCSWDLCPGMAPIWNLVQFDTIFSFSVEDLTPLNYVAESLNYDELISFIETEKSRGSTNIERYMVV